MSNLLTMVPGRGWQQSAPGQTPWGSGDPKPNLSRFVQ